MPDGLPANKPQWSPRWCALLILVTIAVTFGPLARCGFTDWDDQDTVWSNPRMRPATLQSIGYYWNHAEAELYIPLTYTVWGGLSHLGQSRAPNGAIAPNPVVYHVANIMLHMLSALAAFAILRRLIKHDWAACAGALLFALHPVQTEAVAWVSGLKDLLCALFVLTALWQYIVWVQDHADSEPTENDRRRWIGRAHYGVALVSLFLATLCKPTPVVAPIIALLIDVALLRRSGKAAMRSLWPWFLAVFPCVVWTKAAQPASLGAGVSIFMRPLIACDAMAFYLWKMAWPLKLGMDYGRNPSYVTSHPWAWFTWLVPVTIAVVLWAGRNRIRLIACGAMLAVAGVLPVLGFIPFEFQTKSTVADHYLYVSMLGVALAAAWMIARRPTRFTFCACAILLGLLALRSMDQTRHWQDSRALFARALEINPQSEVACQNLGVLAGYDAENAQSKAEIYAGEKDFTDAKRERAEAIEKLSESEQMLARALQITPGSPFALHTRAALHARFGRHEEAIKDLRKLVAEMPELRSDEQELFSRDGNLLGRELLAAHHPDEAAQCFDQMLKVQPNDQAALRGRAIAASMSQHAAPTTHPIAETPTDPAIR